MTPPRLVCFDLGGVIIRICRSWAEGCAAAGVPLRGDTSAADRLGDLHDSHNRGIIDGKRWAESVCESLGGRYTPEEILAVHAAWTLGEYEGVDRIIERLHDAEVTTAALSNTNHEHWSTLARRPTIRRLTHRVVSHEIGLTKPEPAIYRAFEDATGARGDEIQFFDDLDENVEAAARAGWRAVRIDPGRETAPQIAEALRDQGVPV